MTPAQVLTTAQTTSLDSLFMKVFTFVVNFLYSIVSYLVDFFTKSEVLGSIIVIALIYTAWKMIKRRKVIA